MTILVSGNKISVRNATGQVKFTSDDKLLYPRYSKTGTVNLGTGSASTSVSFTSLGANEFLYITTKFTACSGNIMSNFLNQAVPANNAIITHHYGYYLSNSSNCILHNRAVAEQEVVTVHLAGSSLLFGGYFGTFYGSFGGRQKTSTIEYKAHVYAY